MIISHTNDTVDVVYFPPDLCYLPAAPVRPLPVIITISAQLIIGFVSAYVITVSSLQHFLVKHEATEQKSVCDIS